MSDEMPMLNSNPDESMRIARDVFTPALQQACATAREQGAQEIDIINGALNAHANLLVQLLGYGPAAGLMKAHAEHIDKVKDQKAAAAPEAQSGSA